MSARPRRSPARGTILRVVDGTLPPRVLAAVEAGELDALVRFDTEAMRLHQRVPYEVSWRDGPALVSLTHESG